MNLFNSGSPFRLFICCFILVLPAMFFVFANTKEAGAIKDMKMELDGLKVPPGFSIERVAEPGMVTYPMFASFDGRGRLFVFESDGSSPTTEDMRKYPPYHVRLLEDTNDDGIFDKSKIFADSLSFPKGGVFYKGSLYVTASPDLLRLTDTDGDGIADKREVILTGWVLNHNGALLGGPFFGPDGWMYLTDARRGFNITTKEGENLKGKSARIWRCRPDGSGLEAISGGGYDNAIELVFMPSGETIGTMTYFIEPQAGMRDALMHWVEGGVYPKPYPVIELDRYKLTGDLMPVMTKMARVAPSGLLRYRGAGLGKEYAGNLFSAEFNTGRIIRHQITPDGATFRTLDDPFITSTVSDIHLTDVMEDADGSMLVLNTGGWFIEGCPLSRIAKLDVHGGIYRIRKTGTPSVSDPWGKQLNLQSFSAERLTELMKDQRQAVRDNAIERLVEIGAPAIAQIKNTLLVSANAEVRTAAVFALYRINTPEALLNVRAALLDPSVVVRTAAARVLGLAKDPEAVDRLMQIVQNDQAPVRRQAATALGQIADTRAVAALLKAAARNNDRFIEHAIIFALIQLKDPAPLMRALSHSSSSVKKAAIIALDQMDGLPLRKENLVPFLASKDTDLRNTGIWVASHHKDWADIVVSFLKNRLSTSDLTGGEVASIRSLMISFSENKQLQQFLALQLAKPTITTARKALLVEVIDQSPVKEIPTIWVEQLGKLLQNGDDPSRSLVLGLVESRNIRTLNQQLNEIFQNAKNPSASRIKALGSRLITEPKLSEAEFGLALQYLDKKYDAALRQLAARLLAAAKLSDEQLLTLANKQVSKADIFLLQDLLNPFEASSNKGVGEALIGALKSDPARLDEVSEQNLEKLFAKYPQPVKASSWQLIEIVKHRNAGRVAQLQVVEARLKRGDVGQGRKIFFGKAICSSCHAVGSEGDDFAPDLSNIGQIRSKHDILEAILFPSASFAREHETFKVVTKTKSYTGIIREQLPGAVVLSIAPGQNVRISRNQITAIEPLRSSMMPAGLDKQLSQEELSDLMAYLTSLPDGMGGHGNEH